MNQKDFEGHSGGQCATAGGPFQRIKQPVPGQSTAPRRLMAFAKLPAKLGVSERTARKIIAEPWFPKAIVLAPRVLRFVESEIDEALASRAPRRAEPAAEPEQLTRGKVERLKRAGAAAGQTAST